MSAALATGPWRDLRKRLATALVLAPLVLVCIWLGEGWFDALMAVCMAGMAWEWVRMCGGTRRDAAMVALPAGVLLASGLSAFGLPWAGLLLLAPAAALVWRLAPPLPPRFLASGLLYLGLAGVALLTLRHDPTVGRANVIFILLVVWASDTGAYMAGRALGGPKLAPAISPGKTWSGAAGGLAGAMLVGLLAAALTEPGGGLLRAALVAGVLGVVSQAGDLLESGIKRRFGVKDSSQLIPGHGGLLDRLDGILAVAPVAAALGVILGSGVYLWR